MSNLNRHGIVSTILVLLVVASSLGAATGDAAASNPQTITFASGDSLMITADLYLAHDNLKAPFIVLFHQARWSRGEYVEIAPRLNELGFNCMAIDQRSGGAINDIVNETHARAEAAGKWTEYIDAQGDMVAALEHARREFVRGELLAWGSSYSAALAIKIAGDNPRLVDGVLSFAPGEYFAGDGRSETWIQESAAKVKVPVFMTSARREHGNWEAIFAAIPAPIKVDFLPETAGNHGSRALWQQFDDSEAYWNVVEQFLISNFMR